MWRHGEWLYALLVFGAVLLEASALAYLVFLLTARTFGMVSYVAAYRALLEATLTTSFLLLFLGLYILLYHAYTEFKEAQEKALSHIWLSQFTEALFGAPLPPPPWPRVALEALLSLRETLKGEMAEKVTEWIRRVGLPVGVLKSRWASRPARLEVLDILARARLPEVFFDLLPYLEHPDPVLRLAAARTIARLVRLEDAPRFEEALLRAGLPRGALLEVLLLLEDRSPPVLERLLEEGGPSEQWASLEAVGRLRVHPLVERVLPFLSHEDPELKAAAMRALWRLGYPPLGYEAEVLSALFAGEEFLRLQAVRLLPFLSPELARKVLWDRLGDSSFYVRKGAAEALRGLDPALLERAAQDHPDPHARAMARQILQEG